MQEQPNYPDVDDILDQSNARNYELIHHGRNSANWTVKVAGKLIAQITVPYSPRFAIRLQVDPNELGIDPRPWRERSSKSWHFGYEGTTPGKHLREAFEAAERLYTPSGTKRQL